MHRFAAQCLISTRTFVIIVNFAVYVPARCRAIRKRRHCGRRGPRARKRPATLPVSPNIAACRASAIPAVASRNQLQQVQQSFIFYILNIDTLRTDCIKVTLTLNEAQNSLFLFLFMALKRAILQ